MRGHIIGDHSNVLVQLSTLLPIKSQDTKFLKKENLSHHRLESEILISLKNIYMDDWVVGYVQDGGMTTLNIMKEWD